MGEDFKIKKKKKSQICGGFCVLSAVQAGVCVHVCVYWGGLGVPPTCVQKLSAPGDSKICSFHPPNNPVS